MAMFEIHAVDEQVKALPTYKTASGSVATFNTDMTENLISCIAEIVAQQASGTPTPSSPLPISGFNSLNLVRCGKNLINDSLYYQQNANVVVIGQTVANTNRLVFLKAGTYTIKLTSLVEGSIYYDMGNGPTRLGSTNDACTFTLSEDSYCSFWLYKSGGYSPTDYSNLQLEQGNQPTTCEPYNGTTFTVSFGQTVYGGYIDVVTGKLVITHGFKIFNGSESWNKHGTIPSWFYVDNAITDGYMNNGENDFQICNFGIQTRYADVLSLQNGHFVYGSANKRFIFKNTDYTEVADFQTWLSNNNMQVAYKLDTPIELDVSSVAIPTLNGTNNIFADTGDISECKFILSVGEYLRQN